MELSADRWSLIRTIDLPILHSDRTSPASRSVDIPRRTRSRRIAVNANDNCTVGVSIPSMFETDECHRSVVILRKFNYKFNKVISRLRYRFDSNESEKSNYRKENGKKLGISVGTTSLRYSLCLLISSGVCRIVGASVSGNYHRKWT